MNVLTQRRFHHCDPTTMLFPRHSSPEIKDISSPLCANNYQWYIVLHTGTIEYQENSIWRRSRLDLQRSVFRTMTYTIWAPQIFYLMKRKRKEDLQVNLWDFSRPSDDMMSEFWFASMKFSRQDYWICIERLAYFYSEKDLRNNLPPCKNINKCGRRFEDQRCPCFNYFSHSFQHGVSSLTQHGK